MSNQELLDNLEGTEIAVIGMAGRFPGADNIEKYWENIRDGVETVVTYTDEQLREAGVSENLLQNPNYVKSGAPLDNMEMFDAPFFGFSPRDAAIMDPQHRHFIEVSWTALEHAGYDPSRYEGSIGIFGGSGHNIYMPYNLMTNPALMESVGFFLIRHTSNDKDFLVTRVSYLLDLKGPSINVQTACSTSLVAMHLGVQSLLNQEADIILAGGVTFDLPHRQGYLYEEGEILAPDGHCRAFDVDSQGTRFGSGVGLVVLKRLDEAIVDGDTIHAVIKGTAVNNDGSNKVNYLAPSVDGQAEAINEALMIANVDPETVTYIETHGTGTPIGDPIEVAALSIAYGAETTQKQFCGIGSVKPNIGHLDTAAGVAGFIKTVQALKHKQMPPSLNFTTPNPSIDFENSPFFVNAQLRAWETEGFPRRAGVSSLGVGGTNAHIILEEAPELEPSDVGKRPYQILPLSAKTTTALDRMSDNLLAFLQANRAVNLADVAYTLQLGRQPFAQRRVIAASNVEEAIAVLEAGDRNRLLSQKTVADAPEVIFMFPGGGAQYPNMGRDLYETEAVYRQQIDLCLALLQSQLDVDLRALLFPAEGAEEAAATALQRPSLSLPAIFMTELALAELWLSWGIEPVAMTGHSMGEYTAACLAGVLSVADALSIVTLRGKLFETLPEGGMISVFLPESELLPLLIEDLGIAVINSPNMCVVSGRVEALERMETILAAKEIDARRINIRVAAHSAMLDGILAEFEQHLQQIDFQPPTRPFISNVTGKWADPQAVVTPQYWVTHLRHTVRFADGLQTLMQENGRLFLEVGPGQTLTSLCKQHPAKKESHGIVSSMRHHRESTSDDLFAYNAFGRLWLAGLEIPWRDQYQDEFRRRIPLPTYSFDHQRYWIEPGVQIGTAVAPVQVNLTKLKDLDQWLYKPEWSQVDINSTVDGSSLYNWLIFVDAYHLGQALAAKLTDAGHKVVLVQQGTTFIQQEQHHYQLRPDSADDYRQLVSALNSKALFPQRILHMWTLNERGAQETAVAAYHKNQKLGFYSLLYLAQALATENIDDLQIRVFANGVQQVQDEPVIAPEKATLLGPVKVIPQEILNVTCQFIDLELPVRHGNGSSPVDSTLISTLLNEINADIVESVIAYRNGKRWEQRFVPAKLTKPESPQAVIKEGGIYLITGGLGGIALAMAENLTSQARIKLILTSRSGLPERGEWDKWLSQAGVANKTSHAIQKIRALEAMGAEVMVAKADITNRAQMTQLLQTIHKQWGGINGVIHAAGVLNDGLIQLKTREDVEQVLQPKVDGTLLLDELLADAPLDFFVLFSSTSSVLGPAGQIDYVGANAFLNAFAQSRTARTHSRTVAINWGVWQEVGMAARAARGEFEEPSGMLMPHPLLDRLVIDSDDVIEYITDYRIADFWLLDQHRLKNDEALIPGTGYLEIVKAAIDKGIPNGGTVEIRDLVFIQPLDVSSEEVRRVKVHLVKEEDAYALTVSSQSNLARNREVWTEHVQGTVAHVTAEALTLPSIAEILARCQEREVTFALREQQTKQEAYLNFGPRWKNLRRMNFGENEALAYLELLPEFAEDTESYLVHPALMDLATSFALPLLEGYDNSEAFYVPFMYQKVTVFAPLPDKIYSHARYRADSSSEMPVFDVTIYDEQERPLIDIHGFQLMRVEATGLISSTSPAKATVEKTEEPFSLLDLSLTEGILPNEGVELFNRILMGNAPPQIIASSLDMALLIEKIRQDMLIKEDEKADEFKLSRPELQSDYLAPRSEVERILVSIWENLLGILNIGIEDDFFELGGHSLLAIRSITHIRKQLEVEISLRDIFDSPVIVKLAQQIEAMLWTRNENTLDDSQFVDEEEFIL